MKTKRNNILMWVLALLPLAAALALYRYLPERVPMNWGLNGEVSYSDKNQLWLMFLLSPLLALLFQALPAVDPRRKNYARFRGYYNGFCLVMLLFLAVIDGIVLVEAMRPGTLSVVRMIILGVGILFVFLGNILPKVKNNFFMGVRTPWTLSDPDVWNRANRLGGQLFFTAGVLIMVSGLAFSNVVCFVVMMVTVLCAALIPAVMSYIWYRQKHPE